jgi:hypothetical protein
MAFLVSVMPHARGECIHPDRMEIEKLCAMDWSIQQILWNDTIPRVK